jgi:hypothetical protein
MKDFLLTILIIGAFILGLFALRIIGGLLVMFIGEIVGGFIEFVGENFN